MVQEYAVKDHVLRKGRNKTYNKTIHLCKVHAIKFTITKMEYNQKSSNEEKYVRKI